ncbi:MAG: YbdD/YjiX family protein [Bifidobacteriaceae bacterium]|jgi:hypothetical protein|nr:YbdD/YjiX family protein [Bifidobacteriaceae bacterium]
MSRPRPPLWRRAISIMAWYWREFFGENAYDKYLARHHLAHANARAAGLAHEPLTRREFYRQLSESTPPRGCC